MKKNYYWVIVAVIAIIVIGVFYMIHNNNKDYYEQNKEMQESIKNEGARFQEQKDKALRETTNHKGLIESINTVNVE